MSMIAALCTVRDETIDRLLADPPLVWRLIAPEVPELYLEASGALQNPRLWQRLTGKTPASPTPEVPDLDLTEGEAREVDLDKAWHGIHYLLTGSAQEGAPPLNFLVVGGASVGDVDVGFGPARAFRANEVQHLAAAMAGLRVEGLRARFDPAAMMAQAIYPEIWEADPADAFAYCAEYFEALKQFIRDAADANLGVVIHLS